MDLTTYLTYRTGELEIAQAALRAERARVAAERPEQVVPHVGILRRAARAITARSAASATARRAESSAATRTATRAACETLGSANDRTPHPA